MNYNELVDNYNPFDNFRKYQKEAIIEILEYLNNGVENILLDAPVGFGKSLAAYVIAQTAWKGHLKESYILTSTKYLQDQYLNDFKDLVTCKGRSNFVCAQNGNFCSKGSCQTMNYKCPMGANTESGVLDFKNKDLDTHCAYWTQKVNAVSSPIAILNYKYALTETSFVKHFGVRDISIIDEAHNCESEIMNFLEVKISPKQVKRDVNYDIDFLGNEVLPYADAILEIAELYKDKASLEQDFLLKKAYIERYENLVRASNDFTEDSDNWIAEFNQFDGNIVFKPIEIKKYSQKFLLPMADQRIFMSGSFLKPDVFAEDLGLDDYELVEIPSIISPQNRPIIKTYAGSMSSRNIDSNIKNMVLTLLKIAEHHPNEKGIVHTYTYSVAKKIENELKNIEHHMVGRFVFHDSKSREFATNMFKKSKDPMIFVSPYSYEGVDFKGDESRFQVIAKNPFPNLNSHQIRLRDIVSNHTWLYRERCKILSQMYGRSIRSEDDYAITYLIDSDIEGLLGDATLVTTYMMEGFDSYINKKVTILDENKLSSDKRKSYEEERQQERIILNGIKSGLDTLTKLRDAYKKIEGDSYKVVTPTFNRLLQNGAITVE